MIVQVKVNGRWRKRDVPPGMRLLDFLRDELHLTGTKEGCGEGECGACTVLLDGAPVCSCLVLAGQAGGREVTTIEGVRETEAGRRLIEAFAREGAVQCGFCTPGMIVAAYPLVAEGREATPEAIREALSGNLCRCTGYRKVVLAVQTAVQADEETDRSVNSA